MEGTRLQRRLNQARSAYEDRFRGLIQGAPLPAARCHPLPALLGAIN
jgi:hypothetical protein